MNYEIKIKELLSESAHVETPFLAKYKVPGYPKDIQESERSDFSKLPQSPLVSVLVLAYNKADYIRECIQSILSQRTSFAFEIVVAEDCSTDTTRDILFFLQRQYPEKIRVVYANANVGVIRNTLRGLRFCRGKYIAHIDGDDYCATGTKLQGQVNVFEEDKDVSLVYTGGYVQLEKMKFLRVPLTYRTRRRLAALNSLSEAEFAKMLLLNNPMVASSVMIRADAARLAIEHIGMLFDYTAWFPCQDFELWFYGAVKGKCRYLDELSIVYRHNKGAATAAESKTSSARCLGDIRNGLAITLQERLFNDEEFAKKIIHKFLQRYSHYVTVAGIEDQSGILSRYSEFAGIRQGATPPSRSREAFKTFICRNYLSYMLKSLAIRLFRI